MQRYVARHMRKIWSCLFIVAVLFTLAACGGATPATSSSVSPTAARAPSPTATGAPFPTPVPTWPQATPPVSGGAKVSIKYFAYNPQSLTIKVGTTVTWTNEDNATHTVTADTGVFNASINPGKSVSFTFTIAGTYQYHCDPHPDMIGTIVVQ
jgi:plastocyanin